MADLTVAQALTVLERMEREHPWAAPLLSELIRAQEKTIAELRCHHDEKRSGDKRGAGS